MYLITYTRLTKTNVFGLLQGAVLTVGVYFDPALIKEFRAGKEIRFETEDENCEELACLILDVESVGPSELNDRMHARMSIRRLTQ